MGMSPIPSENSQPYEWALWLHEQLQGLRGFDGRWEGSLPEVYDFASIVRKAPDGLITSHDEPARRIAFSPTKVGVFENLNEFLSAPASKLPPQQFAILKPFYIHGKGSEIPTEISQYLGASRLWSLLKKFSDAQNLGVLLFIKSHDSKLWIKPDYTAEQLTKLEGLDDFERQYFTDDHHKDQKRNLVRNALIEIFKPEERIDFGVLLGKFSDLVEKVRGSYALFVQDFSYEKLVTAVEKLNLDDTLRLNKVFADIQNQLLALPAALLAAGAGFKAGILTVNIPILFGVLVFAWVMWHLINNQKNSINAITLEVDTRKKKIAALPGDLSGKLLPFFKELESRSKRQAAVLEQIRWAVIFVAALVFFLFVHLQWPWVWQSVKNSGVYVAQILGGVWTKISTVPVSR